MILLLDHTCGKSSSKKLQDFDGMGCVEYTCGQPNVTWIAFECYKSHFIKTIVFSFFSIFQYQRKDVFARVRYNSSSTLTSSRKERSCTYTRNGLWHYPASHWSHSHIARWTIYPDVQSHVWRNYRQAHQVSRKAIALLLLCDIDLVCHVDMYLIILAYFTSNVNPFHLIGLWITI